MALRRALDWFLRSRETGGLVVAQAPNAPLWAFLGASAASLAPPSGGAAEASLRVIATLSLVVWAGDEVLRGVNPFRRLLGAATLAYLAWGATRGS